MKQVGHAARMGKIGLHIGFWWESQREEVTRTTWKYNIKIDFGEIVWGGMD
jgi:hypothetical protein